MRKAVFVALIIVLCTTTGIAVVLGQKERETLIPKFSVDYMDKTVSPGSNFYRFAVGNWLKNNPVPADKSRLAGFLELDDRNNYLVYGILKDASSAVDNPDSSPRQEVGDLFASAMDTNTLEKLRFKPIEKDIDRINHIDSLDDLFVVLAEFHNNGISAVFSPSVDQDYKNSAVNSFQLNQGGLSLPDRSYYLDKDFFTQREAFASHVQKMFILLGESSDEAKGHAASVIAIESDLAKASSSPVELRDVNKNYNKVSTDDLIKANPVIPWRRYLNDRELSTLPYSIVGQPEFFRALNKLLTQHSLADWKSYMRWHLLNDEAPYLHKDVEEEHFNFYGKVLSGQEKPAPRWVRAVEVVKANLGEAIGQLYVEKYFTDDAKTRIHELINNLRLVFRDRLKNLSWMSEATRAKALAKLDSMQQKIGCPDKFRNYSSIQIRRDDYLANVRRCNAFEIHRKICQVGKPVDRSEWAMMPTTADCYNNPRMNEIVFPAGQLQPPFFDISMDDAVNYGGIGVMIGHEITHGFDDQGRHYDAAGNLSEWWTDKDAQEFEKRAQRVISQYDSFEALPGLHVNGKLTLGENIGDLGGVKIAYYALERALEKDPSKRKIIDGFTPEQRFFISWAQVERMNTRDAELKRLLTVNPHAPGEFRAIGPLVNFDKFFEAFGIKNSDPMWRKPEQRTEIW